MYLCAYVSGYAFRSPATYRNETWHGGRGRGPEAWEQLYEVTRGQRSGQIWNCSDWAQIRGKWCWMGGDYKTGIEKDALWCCTGSKVRSNFKLLRNLGKVMLDGRRLQNGYRGGRPLMLYGVKGQVKFQVAPIELKLGESNAGGRVSKKHVSRRMPSDAIRGQRSGQISNCFDWALTRET